MYEIYLDNTSLILIYPKILPLVHYQCSDIEVTFKVAFSLRKNKKEGVEIRSRIKRCELFERYSDSFFIKVSWIKIYTVIDVNGKINI